MHPPATVHDVVQPSVTSPAVVYLAGLGPGSVRTMRNALVWLAREASANTCGPEDLPWHLLEWKHVDQLRARLAATYAPATANRHLDALRGVLKCARRMGLMTAEQFAQATDHKPVRGKKIPAGRAVDPDVRGFDHFPPA